MAIALMAAACGTEVAPTVQAADGPDSTAAGSSTSQSTVGGASSDASAEEAEGPAAAPVEEHLFPDINTLNIVDGSTVNLAQELAGGDTPVLLWFWAPH